MGDLKFFKDFKQKFESLEKQVVVAEDLAQVRQISVQLATELEKYKQAINNCFDSLWDKRNKHNQLLADSMNSQPLEPEQYKQIASQLKQLDCDIKALTDFIKQVNPEVTIAHYEERLNAINEQISSLEQSASFRR
ncbi:hypothetical protein [Legionella jordanis]|uniref:Coiled coil protein n=1 Tax=Legionella jordanis TaxID=456 RepID=A0A0W0V8M5_9GAMM|nr:hypothetical protein [Legionella jordanis]KTD16442.1 hypothetical protein Ljor_0748 [Legionella jordanis]RMX04358.1 hypothetical protein EAW55_02670 [Legionella jordanis]RMX15296.1 hypothetical protein EAS68_12860 [Legionella jordanis]VEH12098.1 Uncharacterised protein [Legionella jordanis]HAT8712601.1 hypothetical protein [Legionella jordanis]